VRPPARLVEAGVTLRNQLNTRFPKRDKRSDGWIGDRAHSIRRSDHNPDRSGWVHAIDVDEDFGAKGSAEIFARQLIDYCRRGLDNGRVKNVVYENRVASGTFPDRPGRPPTFWVWRKDPSFGHTKHIHISFTRAADTDGTPFHLPILAPPAKPAPVPVVECDQVPEPPKKPARKKAVKK